MSCNRHFLNFEWEHHTWQPRVVGAETLHARETTMWGGSANLPYVRCRKHEVCTVCGKTTETRSCTCDPEVGETCDVRLAWMASGRPHQ